MYIAEHDYVHGYTCTIQNTDAATAIDTCVSNEFQIVC